MGIMKTLASAHHARRIRQPAEGEPMATATPAKSANTPATKKPATKKPAAKSATTAPAAPATPAVSAVPKNTVANGRPAVDGATLTAATHKRKYRPGYKAVLLVTLPDG